MPKKRFLGILVGIPAIIFLLSLEAREQSPAPSSPPPPLLLKSGDLKWTDAPPTVPKGARVALVYGEPAKGPYAQFVKIPKGYIFPPHRHEQTEWVALISGTVVAGFGEKINEDSGTVLTTGGYGFIPAGTPHWALAKTDVLFYQHVGGAASITYVDPAEDPRSRPR